MLVLVALWYVVYIHSISLCKSPSENPIFQLHLFYLIKRYVARRNNDRKCTDEWEDEDLIIILSFRIWIIHLDNCVLNVW